MALSGFKVLRKKKKQPTMTEPDMSESLNNWKRWHESSGRWNIFYDLAFAYLDLTEKSSWKAHGTFKPHLQLSEDFVFEHMLLNIPVLLALTHSCK